MIRIRLFGGAVLEHDGRPVTGRTAQRHPLALLALLAASPGQAASRDKLIAYLWPESDTPHARHRLSVALHVLRRGLPGDECLITRSDGVALNPTVVWTDVGAFLDALAAGRLEEAVGLRTGPFLDGFFLSGAPDFERWVDAERARLDALYVGALQRLAEEAGERGEPAAAVPWWRLLARHDPCSAPVALGVMRALVAVGDRAGALRHARAHAALLQAEFGVEPDPAVAVLAAQLAAAPVEEAQAPAAMAPTARRSGPGEAKAARTRAPAANVGALAKPGLRGQLIGVAGLALLVLGSVWGVRRTLAVAGPDAIPTVAVMPFVSAGGLAEEARLGAGLAGDIIATLAHVPDLRLLTDVRLPASPDESVALAMARALQADLLLTGSLLRDSGGISVATTLLEVGTGQARWAGDFTHPATSEAGFQDEVSLAIADALRSRLAPYLPKVYTRSERAYDRFLQGVYAHRRMTPQDLWKALQFYREAYEEDEGFALAHAISANAYIDLVAVGLPADVGYRHAREHALSALARDSTLAEGHVALAVVQIWHDWDFQAGERSLRRAVILYPTLPQARSYYGAYLLRLGHSPDAALEHIRHALAVDPLNAARSHVVERALHLARRYEEVIEQNQLTRALGRDEEFTFLGSPLADAYRELGRYEESIGELLRVQARTEADAAIGLALTYARAGRSEEARTLLREIEQRAAEGGVPAEEVARVHASLGDADRAMEWLERAYESRSSGLLSLRIDPAFDPLRNDLRFDELRRRIGLPP